MNEPSHTLLSSSATSNSILEIQKEIVMSHEEDPGVVLQEPTNVTMNASDLRSALEELTPIDGNPQLEPYVLEGMKPLEELAIHETPRTQPKPVPKSGQRQSTTVIYQGEIVCGLKDPNSTPGSWRTSTSYVSSGGKIQSKTDPSSQASSSVPTIPAIIHPPTSPPLQPQPLVGAPSQPNAGAPSGVSRERWMVSGKVLGKGAFGVVYQGLDRLSGQMVAIKEMPVHKTLDLEMEMNMLAQLKHPNIVAYVGSYMTHSSGTSKLIMVMEYVPCGSLDAILKTYKYVALPALRVYSRDILQGLAYLHTNHIIHRDIKPANILVGLDGKCKLADFGLSRDMGSEGSIYSSMSVPDMQNTMPAGTPAYMTPESIQGTRLSASDVWATGLTILELATATKPWSHLQANNTFALIFAIVSEAAKGYPVPEWLPINFRDFISYFLDPDSKSRSPAERLLHHPWVVNDNSHEYDITPPHLENVPNGPLTVEKVATEIAPMTQSIVATPLAEPLKMPTPSPVKMPPVSLIGDGSPRQDKVLMRLMSSKMIKYVIGNTHELVAAPKRSSWSTLWTNLSSAKRENKHEWTMFVQFRPDVDSEGPDQEDRYIKHVTYHLHPTFRSNEITVTKPPFKLTRKGWGEFEVGVEFHFVSPDTPSVTHRHMLCLTKPRTCKIVEFEYHEVVGDAPTVTPPTVTSQSSPSTGPSSAHSCHCVNGGVAADASESSPSASSKETSPLKEEEKTIPVERMSREALDEDDALDGPNKSKSALQESLWSHKSRESIVTTSSSGWLNFYGEMELEDED